MRTFEIRLFDRYDRYLNSLPAQVTTRGQAYRIARTMLGGVACRFEIEEI